jgi:hypothetical protein
MNATTTTETTALALSSASAGALLMSDASMDRLERIADLMASGKTTVPNHLRGNKGDCFAICLQSMQWGMNPFSVAQKTFLVNGVLGYEAQLVAAVINNSGLVVGRFKFEWFGEWEKIVGKFKEVTSTKKLDDNGQPKKYIVPDWRQEDERGLGVRVWATIKGESEPRVLEILMTQARTRNSTLWTEDPKQQIAYLVQKRWARLYTPDVILGVYTPDELAEAGVKFMGDAEVVDPPPPPAPPPYSADEFEKNLPAWTKVIQSGRKTAEDLINFVNTRGTPYTDDQAATLRAIKVVKNAGATDVEPKAAPAAEAQPAAAPATASAKTYAEVADAITKAQSMVSLNVAIGQIGDVADDGQRDELTALAARRAEELPPF